MSSGKDRVERLPLREDLPKEFAAISLPAEEEGDDPTIIINVREERPRAALRYLRPHILIPILIGWAADKIRRFTREHPLGAAASVVIVSVGAAAAMTTLMDRRPPAATEQTVIVTPPPPATLTVTATGTTPRWTVPPTTEEPPRAVRSPRRPVVGPATVPSRTQEHARTPRPPTAGASPSVESIASTVPSTEVTGPPTPALATELPPAGQTPALPAAVPSGDEPFIAATGDDCGGLVHVDLDPLADVCLLS